jgi:hypothetical protein
MAHQSPGAFGQANPVPLSPQNVDKKEEKKEEFDEDIDLETALTSL